MATSPPPFTTRMFSSVFNSNGKDSRQFLPATRRTKDDGISIPSPSLEFLETDLLVPKLERIQQWLWLCGWLMPPRPLHHQLVLSREIVISEDPNMHLVWHENRIMIKPLPPYLLDPDFWTRHILSGSDGDNRDGNDSRDRHDYNYSIKSRRRQSNDKPNENENCNDNISDAEEEEEIKDEEEQIETTRHYVAPSHHNHPRHPKLADCARGLLFSYTALIAYESDFHIAKDRNLIPQHLEWTHWQTITAEFLQQRQQSKTHEENDNNDSGCYASYHPRYWYGELRLNRLDKIYIFTGISPLRGYSRVAGHGFYSSLLSAQFATLATLLGYLVLVLGALQVGFGVDRLSSDRRFQDLGFGFVLFSILAPVVAGVGILLGLLPMVVSNLVATRRREEGRFRGMGVEPEWKMKGKGKKRKQEKYQGYEEYRGRKEQRLGVRGRSLLMKGMEGEEERRIVGDDRSCSSGDQLVP